MDDIHETFNNLRTALDEAARSESDTTNLQEQLRIDILEQQTVDLNRIANALEKIIEKIEEAIDADAKTA
jgi:hypothetical protein